MPIKDWSAYPADWHLISSRIRHSRAGDRCEWVDERGHRCEARNWSPHPETGSWVVLTVGHLDHDTTNNDERNLLAMCQLHHLRHDAAHHVVTARAKRRQRQRDAGQLGLDLPPGVGWET